MSSRCVTQATRCIHVPTDRLAEMSTSSAWRGLGSHRELLLHLSAAHESVPRTQARANSCISSLSDKTEGKALHPLISRQDMCFGFKGLGLELETLSATSSPQS